jgi:predicted RNase H-like nuclease (RuvC/YqgF family)
MRKKLDRLKSDLEEMKSLTKKLRLFRKLELKGYVPIIEMEETRDSIAKDLDRTVDLEERVVFVKHPENAQVLNDYRIKALIVPNKPSEKMLEKVNFPVIVEKDISIENIKSILVARKEELEEEIKKARKLGFVQWLKSHRRRKF